MSVKEYRDAMRVLKAYCGSQDAKRTANNGGVKIRVYRGTPYETAFSLIDSLLYANTDVDKDFSYEEIKHEVMHVASKMTGYRKTILLSKNTIIPFCFLLIPQPYESNECEFRIAYPSSVEDIEPQRFFITHQLGINYFSEL